MSLAERVNESGYFRGQCLTCIWIRGLPEPEKKAFAKLVARTKTDDPNKLLSRAQLHRICRDEAGLSCGQSSFYRHLDNQTGRHVVVKPANEPRGK